jgi:hypothetical protein
MLHTTFDFPLLLGDGSGRVVVPAPLPPSPPPEPPPPGAQLTSMSWSAGSALSLLANAAAGSELVLTTGRHDHRADRPATITTADADVSSWTSGQSLAGTVTQGTAANRPTHSQATGIVTFAGATSGTDTTTGKWLGFPTGAGTLPTRYADSSNNALGIAYLLVRFPVVPTWRTRLFGVGTLNNTFANERRGHGLDVNGGGQIRFWRADASAVSAATISGAITANEPIAIGFVLNDDRTTPGTPDLITRCLVKTKPSGPYATMAQAATTARTIANNSNPSAFIGRDWYTGAAGGIGNFELFAFAFDYAPPTTDALIEANLDRLLARV